MNDFEHIKKNIEEKAKAEGFELSDKADSIARAKLRFYGRKNWALCPCDPGSDRACISNHCKEDIAKNGVCHCNLYRKVA